MHAFKAINDACLVFDGKLVIDTAFHTNDISIRSAGSVTKYQRRYHAEPWTQKNFNSKEVGIEVGVTVTDKAVIVPERLNSVGFSCYYFTFSSLSISLV